jgi:hypothetical protein
MRLALLLPPILALSGGAMACAAVIGVDGDYVEGNIGGGGAAGAGTAGAPTGGTGAGASGGSGGATSSGGGGSGTAGAGGSERPNGAPCSEAEQCEHNRCVDAVCCENACDGLCERCDAPDELGRCTAVPEGENPDGDCDAEALQACTGDGACKGLPGAACSNNGQCLSGSCDQPSDTCN